MSNNIQGNKLKLDKSINSKYENNNHNIHTIHNTIHYNNNNKNNNTNNNNNNNIFDGDGLFLRK